MSTDVLKKLPFSGPKGPKTHDKWVPFTTAWPYLRLRMERRPPI